jgi:1-acyl-sn-glycerol-3-phosphate acyltransferase
MKKHTYAFYWFMKLVLLGPALRSFFDRVYFVNAQKMTKNKAVLLAGNHPNSFLDGVILAFFCIRRIWVVVRGDVFKHPVANRLLRSLRLLPIFRARDANARVAKRGNEQTEEEMLHLFKKKKSVLIFSEGSSYPEKKLRSLMRGTAKMMLELPDKMKHPSDLSLQSVGLNYDRFFSRGGQFSLVFGDAILREDLTNKKGDDYSIEDLKQMNQKIRADLSPLVVQWEAGDEEVQETLLRMVSHDTDHGWRFVQRSDHYFQRIQAVIEKWKGADNSVRTKAAAYHDALQGNPHKDLAYKPLNGSMKMILALISFIPAALGYILYNPGWWLAEKITFSKIKNPIFIDSIYFGLGLLLGAVSNVIMIVLCILVAPSWTIGIGVYLATKVFYYLYLIFRPQYRHLKERLFSTSRDQAAFQLRKELAGHFLNN